MLSFRFKILSSWCCSLTRVIIFSLLLSCEISNDNIIYLNDSLPPFEALKTFKLPSGFKIELFASEPLVSDPIDMCVDEYGNIYVVEMHGYPLDKSGKGKIKLLKDLNGDGFPDESIIFAENLMWPFGIMRWKKGIIVADSPNILYLEDLDGDGVADVRDTLLTGFAFSNPQMNVGGPIYGLDNWIYLSSEAGGTYQIYKDLFGTLGEDIYFPHNPDSKAILANGSGRTVRFRLDQNKIELTSGVTQFNRTYDKWGRHLLINNSNHIYHEVLQAPYLARNKNLLIPNTIQTLSDHGSKVYPITDHPERQLLTDEGVFTSATGIVAYKGNEFPAPYNEGIFMAEPVSNIIHVDRLVDNMSSFIAERIGDIGKEFLASTDYWFRPVNMYVGPDGALYVVDYYRQIIEHPEWMSAEMVQTGNLNNGINMGRIYRITNENIGSPGEWVGNLDLGMKSNEELIDYLGSTNGWWRETSQRILVDRQDKSIGPRLQKLFQDSSNDMGRLHALWTLDGLELIDEGIIKRGLSDSIAGIRENTIRVAENYLFQYSDLIGELADLKNDPDRKVRFQLLCTLGYDTSAISKRARFDILMRDVDDPWVQVAALSANSFRSADLLPNLLEVFQESNEGLKGLVKRLTELLILGKEENYIGELFEKTSKNIRKGQLAGWEEIVLEGISEGVVKDNKLISLLEDKKSDLIDIYLIDRTPRINDSSLRMLSIIGINGILDMYEGLESEVMNSIQDKSLSGERRGAMIKFISLANPAKDFSFYRDWFNLEEDIPVQLAALKAMNDFNDLETTRYIIEAWDNLSPRIRAVAVDLQLPSIEQTSLFLNAIEKGEIQKSSIDFSQRVRFMTHFNAEIKMRARNIFNQKDETKINREYLEAIKLRGNGENGEVVFRQNCSLCHQYNGELGESIGPDLSTVSSWSYEGILSQILLPSSSIAMGFELWEIELNNGEKFQGIIANESSSAFVIRNVGMEDKEINRSDVKMMNSTDQSLMPGGWGEIISVEEMIDLIAFIRKN